MNKQKILTTLVTGTLLSGALGIVYGADNMGTTELPTYVVTATRTNKAILDVPANTIVITDKQIKDGGYTNLYQALSQLGQLNTDSFLEDGGDYGSMVSRVRIRGLDQGTTLLVNGNPINYTNYSTLNGIPLNEVKKVEIVKGDAATLYGASASAGAINIITKLPKTQDTVTGQISATVGNHRKGAEVAINANNVLFGFESILKKDRDGFTKPGNTGLGTAYNIKNNKSYGYYMDAKLSDKLSLSASRSIRDSAYERGEYKKYVPTWEYLGHYRTSKNYINLVYADPSSDTKVTAGYNTTRIDTIYDKTYPKKYTDSLMTSYMANIDLQKKLHVTNNADLLLGANFTQEQAYSDYQGKISDKKVNSYALYQSYDYHATDSLEYIFGLRENYVAKSNKTKSQFVLLPQLQMLYKSSNTDSYYLNVGKSFVLPRINAAFTYSANLLPNDNLKPQTGWSYEVGYKHAMPKGLFTADVFYMTMKDKMYWHKFKAKNPVTQKEVEYTRMENRDTWTNVGVELNYTNQFTKALSGNVGVTLQNPIATTKGVESQDADKYLVNLGLNYHKEKWNVNLHTYMSLGRIESSYGHDNKSKTGTYKLPAYVVTTLAAQYSPNESSSINLTIDNLFNRQNMISSYGYLGEPREVYVTYQHKF